MKNLPNLLLLLFTTILLLATSISAQVVTEPVPCYEEGVGHRFEPCTTRKLTNSVIASTNWEIISGLTIDITGTETSAGIIVKEKSNVTIKDCLIKHKKGQYGIIFDGAHSIRIINCRVEMIDGANEGPLVTLLPLPEVQLDICEIAKAAESENICGLNSNEILIQDVELKNGATGIFLHTCHNPTIDHVTGFDFRGIDLDAYHWIHDNASTEKFNMLFPNHPWSAMDLGLCMVDGGKSLNTRGQFIQFNKCTGGTISNFYCFNDLKHSFTEDNINLYKSVGQTISNGIIDGNNAPFGAGILWEQALGSGNSCNAIPYTPVSSSPCALNNTANNIQFFRMGNGVGSVQSTNNVTFSNILIADTHCLKVDPANPEGTNFPTRTPPKSRSGGLSFSANRSSSSQPCATNYDLQNIKVVNVHCFDDEFIFKPFPGQTINPNANPPVCSEVWLSPTGNPAASEISSISEGGYTILKTAKILCHCAIKAPDEESMTINPNTNSPALSHKNKNLANNTEENISESLKTTVYPNPTSNYLKIKGLNQNHALVVVKNVEGVTKIEQTIDSNAELFVGNLPDGIYFVQVIQANNMITNMKIVKTKRNH